MDNSLLHSTKPCPNFTQTSNAFGEQHFYEITRGIFDKVGSKVIYDKTFKPHLFSEDALYFIIGTDSGLLLKYIQQQGIPTGTRYIFIELEEVLSELQTKGLLNEKNPSIVIATEANYIEKAQDLKLQEYLYINAVHIVSSLCCEQKTIDRYAPLQWSIHETIQALHWQHQTGISGNQAFITRQLENVADNYRPVQILKARYKNETVIILAGGPSLVDALAWVKQHREKIVVFAVARIAKQLLDAKIEPDFVFAVDPTDISFNMCCDVFRFSDKPILVHSNHLAPKLLSQWHGLSLYMAARLPWECDLNIPNTPGAGPTVTNAALAIADLWGFKTILLAGVDLCFTRQGITHAKGSAEEHAGPKYNTTSLQVKTYSGETRPTSCDFYTAIQNLSLQAKSICKNNKTVINLMKNAANIEGIIHIPPDKVSLPQKLTMSALQAKELFHSYDKRHPITQYHQALLLALKQAHYKVETIQKLTQRAMHINKNLFNDEGLIVDKPLKKELDNIEKELDITHGLFSELVKRYAVNRLIKITTPYEDERKLDACTVQSLGATYYNAYYQGATRLAQLIKEAQYKTQNRLEENSDHPNFEQLMLRWEKDESYRRAQMWVAKHPNYSLPSSVADAFCALSNAFESLCKEAALKNKERLALSLGQIDLVSSKAKLLFHHQRHEELYDLLKSIQSDKRNQDKIDYQALIQGYIAELEARPNDALAHYDIILNHNESPLYEDALRQINTISIKQQNYSNACLALECLSQLSPIYLPHFAEATRLAGDFEGAINIYNHYIERFPNDVETQLKLTRLYIHEDSPLAARMLLDFILQQHPDLEAAKQLEAKIQISQ